MQSLNIRGKSDGTTWPLSKRKSFLFRFVTGNINFEFLGARSLAIILSFGPVFPIILEHFFLRLIAELVVIVVADICADDSIKGVV